MTAAQPTEAPAKPPLHFTMSGTGPICPTPRVRGTELRLAFDPDDEAIDCPLCRMYVTGLRHGRNGA
jgi:hypothetical protein